MFFHDIPNLPHSDDKIVQRIDGVRDVIIKCIWLLAFSYWLFDKIKKYPPFGGYQES